MAAFFLVRGNAWAEVEVGTVEHGLAAAWAIKDQWTIPAGGGGPIATYADGSYDQIKYTGRTQSSNETFDWYQVTQHYHDGTQATINYTRRYTGANYIVARSVVSPRADTQYANTFSGGRVIGVGNASGVNSLAVGGGEATADNTTALGASAQAKAEREQAKITNERLHNKVNRAEAEAAEAKAKADDMQTELAQAHSLLTDLLQRMAALERKQKLGPLTREDAKLKPSTSLSPAPTQSR
ncbi:MAG: hypothetical protein P8H24_07470 [Methylophilaceae bacterium]|nr:hypothetical protein [Methylophilaceae bacterium]